MMADDEKHRREVAAKVADLKARASPEAIQRMTALFEAELARRAAAKKAVSRPTASSAPPAGPDKPLNLHAMDVFRRWRSKR
jgi:hypothetical protein